MLASNSGERRKTIQNKENGTTTSRESDLTNSFCVVRIFFPMADEQLAIIIVTP